jgi:hypothetical protein
VTYPKKFRENPELPIRIAPGQTLSHPVSNLGIWRPQTDPRAARIRFPRGKAQGEVDVIYHDPRFGDDPATNMSQAGYHSKSQGERGLGSDGKIKPARPTRIEPGTDSWDENEAADPRHEYLWSSRVVEAISQLKATSLGGSAVVYHRVAEDHWEGNDRAEERQRRPQWRERPG